MEISFIKKGKNYSNYDQSGLDHLVSNGVLTQNESDELTSGFNEEKVILKRQSAYKSESDPLYMEWQFDQTTESEQAWRDKVTEIKARYPLTVES